MPRYYRNKVKAITPDTEEQKKGGLVISPT